MEMSDAIDLIGAFLILFGCLGFMMLLCLGVISIVPGKKEDEE